MPPTHKSHTVTASVRSGILVWMFGSATVALVVLLAGCHWALPLDRPDDQGVLDTTILVDTGSDNSAPLPDLPPREAAVADLLRSDDLDSTMPDVAAPDLPPADGPSPDVLQPDIRPPDMAQPDMPPDFLPKPDLPPQVDTAALEDLPIVAPIVITEVMVDPKGTEPNAEWFEIYNPSSSATFTLTNWQIADKQWTHTINQALSIGPQQRRVLAHSSGGVLADYYYGGNGGATTDIWFENTNDKIELRASDGITVVDKVEWSGTGWPIVQGFSMSLKSHTLDNSQPANWCQDNTGPADAKNIGSPGAVPKCL